MTTENLKDRGRTIDKELVSRLLQCVQAAEQRTTLTRRQKEILRSLSLRLGQLRSSETYFPNNFYSGNSTEILDYLLFPDEPAIWDNISSQLKRDLFFYWDVFDELVPSSLNDCILLNATVAEFNSSGACTVWHEWGGFQWRAEQQYVSEQPLTTGLQCLDTRLGGLHGLVFLGADEGAGKTSLMLQMINENILHDEQAVALIYNLDMTKFQLFERFCSLNNRVTASQLRDCEQYRFGEWLANYQNVQVRQQENYSLWASDHSIFRGVSGLHDVIVDQVRFFLVKLRELGLRGREKLIVGIDLFQKMDVGLEDGGREADLRRLNALHELKNLLDVNLGWGHWAIIATSEIRKTDRANRTDLSTDDLKGDGRIASDADVVMLMWRNQQRKVTAPGVCPVTLRIAKGRAGVQRGDMELDFHYDIHRFEEVANRGVARPNQPAASERSGTSDALTE